MTVALYILTEKYQDITNALVGGFQTRVETDGGTFEAGNCLKDNITALGGSMGNTETYNRIELFNDEKISITSSLKDVTDLSKTFTDYTQSFTIPASENNNIIFKHWYENAVENGFDQRVRYKGYIEIDTELFRKGKFQIESATIKDGKPQDYKLTFYGNLTSLTDEFGEDKLKDVLALNDYSYEYTASSVIDRVKGLFDYDVMFPLISSDRVWEYGSGGSNNIAHTGHAINTNELFPALKMYRVFEALQTQYGINFNSTFLQTPQFLGLFLLFKNKDAFEFKTEFKAVDLLGANDSMQHFEINTSEDFVRVNSLLSGYEYDPYINVAITPTVTSAEWTLKAFSDGLEYQTYNGTGVSSVNIFTSYNSMANLLDQKITFEISFNQATNYSVVVEAGYTEQDPLSPPTYNTISRNTGTVSASLLLDLTLFAPDIKVTDFFSGFLKMFNLTCYSTDGINYTLETLDYWYQSGRIKDISEYTERDFDISRVQTYKSINFEYEKSESFMNEGFYSNFERRYGDLKYQFSDDGSDYNIKLPFEQLYFNKFDGENLQVGFCLKTDFQKYIPKPIILYKGETKAVDFYMTTGSGHEHILQTPTFGAELNYLNEIYSTNWGAENSTQTFEVINNSLYDGYYLNYLNNLYKKSSRLVKAKAKFPYSLLNSLQLNDRVVIRDKRYVIQKFTTDLLTFEVDLELLQDFRPILPNNSFTLNIDNTAQVINHPIINYPELDFTIADDRFGMINGFDYADDFLTLDIAANTSGDLQIAILETSNNDLIVIKQYA